MSFLIFVTAMGILIWGADILIYQSEKIALRFNIPEFIIGATLIALGTSLPEMAASIAASAENKTDIAISNVIGSNIFNITLVLASVFLIARNISPSRDFFSKDSTWILMPVFTFILVILDDIISRFDAILLLLLMGSYVFFLFQDTRNMPKEDLEDVAKKPFVWVSTLSMLILGFILVIIGAHFTVESASDIAKSFGISEWVIGIILISLGTSLPELVVSVSAAIKGKVDMAIGNIIGSNMANISVVLGSAALIKPLPIKSLHYIFDITVMGIATLLLVFLVANKLYTKSAGTILLIILGLFLEHIIQGF
ncbi:MAG: calcium/sodium antiporter [Sulfurovum sp.]|nr:calcium/sodium antiporter [Sulfurovum sp.]MCB4744651.1 calcium/sodium antiporter [Sulfurovum sp.]MCB4746926.1 calcium/sodium antiporter [Sulfurovum sp.]MCB4749098.1 calcium/sodium antiporter [Sulfurovum sp.]MCB4750469.1 calcium/sodium antiporter [Sulfurovum sp.]